MVGEFEILEKFKVNERFYFKVSCSEGHMWSLRADVYKKVQGCKECHSKYYKSKEYNILDGAKQRCYNPKNIKYKYYGGKGVKVCDRWLSTGYFGVRVFIQDMGKCPEGLSLDRIDVEGDYCPENCRWATPSTQGYNQTKRITNTSGVTGVNWDRDREKWSASITVNRETIRLGRHESFSIATEMRKDAELKYFGVTKE